MSFYIISLHQIIKIKQYVRSYTAGTNTKVQLIERNLVYFR